MFRCWSAHLCFYIQFSWLSYVELCMFFSSYQRSTILYMHQETGLHKEISTSCTTLNCFTIRFSFHVLWLVPMDCLACKVQQNSQIKETSTAMIKATWNSLVVLSVTPSRSKATNTENKKTKTHLNLLYMSAMNVAFSTGSLLNLKTTIRTQCN